MRRAAYTGDEKCSKVLLRMLARLSNAQLPHAVSVRLHGPQATTLICWLPLLYWQVLKKRKLSAILTAWYSQAEHRRDKRAEVAKAGRFWMNQQLAKAWTSWWVLLR